MTEFFNTVDLDNCDREPIHIPGLIQPHGALLAFDRTGALRAWSANADTLLGAVHALDMPYTATVLPHDAKALVEQCLAHIDSASVTTSVEAAINGHAGDCVVHGWNGLAIVEFELREQSSDMVAHFAMKSHAAITQLKKQGSIDALLARTVEEVRAITGFDRVMAYRFRHDDSGDVVAESVRDGLRPYLGMRYPASDIPAQARRLYVLNTLRLISDTGYTPVPMLGAPGDAPVDMSHSVLRSVSPIHVEYLRNMGVGASMSVSIVIDGRLWGLIACHHMAPRRIPYSIRMACDVLAQVLASGVANLQARERAELAEQAAALRTRLLATMLDEDDMLAALAAHTGELAATLQADALVFAHQGKLAGHGGVPPAAAKAMLEALRHCPQELVHRHAKDQWPEDVQAALGPWIGVLGLRFDAAAGGWLLALRREQVETVRWAGKPEKEVKIGPLGPRLTPRGSFTEWLSTVRGQAVPWDAARLLVAEQLLGEMHRASMARHADIERARMQLLAMLGHDLRDPLQSIAMAANVLKQGASTPPQLGQRIERSSGRMQRLIAQVLDMSRLDSGIGLNMRHDPVCLSRLLEDLLDESRTAHPGITYEADIPPGIEVSGDADRLAQVASNLLSNARHHGQPGQPVHLALRRDGGMVEIAVANTGPEIAPDVAAQLFNPFKRMANSNRYNRSGMGLGLYIASRIADGHGGSIAYQYRAPHVVFIVRLPALKAGGAANPAA